MARPLQIEFPSALYHLTSRGDRHEPIFDTTHNGTFILPLYNHAPEAASRALRAPAPEDEDFEASLFRRAQPAMACYCDRHGLPYPELDDDGDLVPPGKPAYRSPPAQLIAEPARIRRALFARVWSHTQIGRYRLITLGEALLNFGLVFERRHNHHILARFPVTRSRHFVVVGQLQ